MNAAWLKPLAFAVALVAGVPSVLAADKVLPIGASEFPPFEYSGPDGKVIGSDTEVVELVVRQMGYKPDIQMQPWARVQFRADKGELAAIYSLTKSAEREKAYYISDPISSVRDVLYKKKSSNITWSTLSDLKAYRVGVSTGYSYDPQFMLAIKQGLFASVDSITTTDPELLNLKKLTVGNVDLFICEINVCNYLIRTNSPAFDGIDHIDKSIGGVRTFHVAFPKTWPGAAALVKSFNEELAKANRKGLIKAIYDKYGIDSKR